MADDDSVSDAAVGHYVKQLTGEEVERLEKDSTCISDYKRGKLEKEAQKNWDLFYKRNTTKFFKDRRWTKREFEDLCETQINDGPTVLLEVGCGVGNFMFPLLEEDENHRFFFYACDLSPRAVQFVKENPLYNNTYCHVFPCDVTMDDLTQEVKPESVDIATVIFVLSAISPEKIEAALTNLHKVLKPGAVVLFRDYGLYDHAMLRFATGHKISEQFYVRQDGTRAYYFKEDEVSNLFCRSGYEVLSCEYVSRRTVNKKEGLCAQRVFVQARFRKVVLDHSANMASISGTSNAEQIISPSYAGSMTTISCPASTDVTESSTNHLHYTGS